MIWSLRSSRRCSRVCASDWSSFVSWLSSRPSMNWWTCWYINVLQARKPGENGKGAHLRYVCVLWLRVDIFLSLFFLTRAMSVFDVIIEYRLSSDQPLIAYLYEKGCVSTLLKNLSKLSTAEIVIVVEMLARMIQVAMRFPIFRSCHRAFLEPFLPSSNPC